jgi:hypothetical protein
MRLVRVASDTMRPPQTEANEIVLADDAVAVLHQVNQQVEHLRLDGNGLGTAVQLSPVGIEHMTGKEKLHVGAPIWTVKPTFARISEPGEAQFQRIPRSRRAILTTGR